MQMVSLCRSVNHYGRSRYVHRNQLSWVGIHSHTTCQNLGFNDSSELKMEFVATRSDQRPRLLIISCIKYLFFFVLRSSSCALTIDRKTINVDFHLLSISDRYTSELNVSHW